jgi:hypothetical protein
MAWQDSDITGGKVRLKHSRTAAETIGADGLVPGEIAINAADGNILYKAADGTVKAIAAGAAHSGRKVMYVSKGDSSTDSRGGIGKYDQSRPFATLVAAKDVAASGDVIIVEPGVYTVKSVNLAKNGVNWFFHMGAEISCAESDVGESLAIFSDATGPMVFKIAGHLKLSCSPTYDFTAIFFSDSASFVDIELDEIHYTPATTWNPISFYNGNLILKARRIYNNAYDAFDINGSNNYVFIKIDEVEVLASIVEFIGTGQYYAEIGRATKTPEPWPGPADLSVDSSINSHVKIGVINGNPVFNGTGGIVEVGLIKAIFDTTPAAYISTDGLFRLHKVVATANQPAIALNHSNASLQQAILIAGVGATNSIVGAHSIKIFGNVVANKAVGANVTQLVGTVTVSTSVA